MEGAHGAGRNQPLGHAAAAGGAQAKVEITQLALDLLRLRDLAEGRGGQQQE